MNKYTVVGWVGMILFLLAYGLVSNEVVHSAGLEYNGLNVVGAIAIAYSLLPAKAWPTIVLEMCFVVIGLVAIAKHIF